MSHYVLLKSLFLGIVNAMRLYDGVAQSPVLFFIKAGVRQGGVLSPHLFSLYIDGLICALENSGLGCSVHGVYMGCIVYADDIFLISHSLNSMQLMLDICSSEIAKLHLKFNTKKSVALRMGPRFNYECAPLVLDGLNLSFVAWLDILVSLSSLKVAGNAMFNSIRFI